MFNFQEFDQAGKDLYMLGLVDTCGGSVSVRNGERFYITKKGAMLGHLREADIVEISIAGEGNTEGVDPGELQVHRAIYVETNFNSVVHAFPPYGIALSISTENKIMPQDMRGQAVLRSIPVVRARVNSAGRDKMASEELVRFLPPVFKSGYVAALVKEYGSFTAGSGLFEALQFTTCLESSCKILAISKSLTGAEKPRRPEQQVRRSALPPSIGVMGRSRDSKRGFGR